MLCSGYIYNIKTAHSFFVNSTFAYMMQKPILGVQGSDIEARRDGGGKLDQAL